MQATVVRCQGDKGGTEDGISMNEIENTGTTASPYLPSYLPTSCVKMFLLGWGRGAGSEEQLFCAGSGKDSVCVHPGTTSPYRLDGAWLRVLFISSFCVNMPVQQCKQRAAKIPAQHLKCWCCPASLQTNALVSCGIKNYNVSRTIWSQYLLCRLDEVRQCIILAENGLESSSEIGCIPLKQYCILQQLKLSQLLLKEQSMADAFTVVPCHMKINKPWGH